MRKTAVNKTEVIHNLRVNYQAGQLYLFPAELKGIARAQMKFSLATHTQEDPRHYKADRTDVHLRDGQIVTLEGDYPVNYILKAVGKDLAAVKKIDTVKRQVTMHIAYTFGQEVKPLL